MKKIKTIGISIVLMLVLIVPSFSIGALKTSITETTGNDNIFQMNVGNHGEIEVVKEVFYDGGWTEGPISPALSPALGDLLQFRINITYHNTSGLPGTHRAHDIRVNDTLPPCLDYVIDTADPVEDVWSDDPNEYLYWDFDEDVILYDLESFVIMYNATVVNITDSGPEENTVFVLWDEQCTGGDELEARDILIITVESEPAIDVTKEVLDPATLNYVKSITAYSGQTLTFRINVSRIPD